MRAIYIAYVFDLTLYQFNLNQHQGLARCFVRRNAHPFSGLGWLSMANYFGGHLEETHKARRQMSIERGKTR